LCLRVFVFKNFIVLLLAPAPYHIIKLQFIPFPFR